MKSGGKPSQSKCAKAAAEELRKDNLKTQVSRDETWGSQNLCSTLIPGHPA
jgi:hypothetical protein